MKYWEIIVNKIIKAGFSVGWASALEDYGHTFWTVDAHRDGKRFVVCADEKLTAFAELERAFPVEERTSVAHPRARARYVAVMNLRQISPRARSLISD
jgi:hypothetical protein